MVLLKVIFHLSKLLTPVIVCVGGGGVGGRWMCVCVQVCMCERWGLMLDLRFELQNLDLSSNLD